MPSKTAKCVPKGVSKKAMYTNHSIEMFSRGMRHFRNKTICLCLFSQTASYQSNSFTGICSYKIHLTSSTMPFWYTKIVFNFASKYWLIVKFKKHKTHLTTDHHTLTTPLTWLIYMRGMDSLIKKKLTLEAARRTCCNCVEFHTIRACGISHN